MHPPACDALRGFCGNWSCPAGEYPSTLEDAAPEIHVSGHLTDKGPAKWINTGDQTGLYRLVMGEGQNAFMANGASTALDI